VGGYDGAGSFLIATNFMVGAYYHVAMDVQYFDLTVLNPFGSANNALFGNREYGPTAPNSQNSNFLLMDFMAPYQVGPPQAGRVLVRCNNFNTFLFDTYPTGFVVNAWYHQTLQRSNSFARVTVVGSNVNVDSGWKDMGAVAPPINTTNCYAGLAMTTLSRGYADNFSLTTYKWVPTGTAIMVR
jgi:hypothetical protein